MKKSTALLGNVCVVALLVSGVLGVSGCKEEKKNENNNNNKVVEAVQKKGISAYWDEQSDINQQAADGSLPLVKAVNAGDESAVRTLLGKGAKTSVPDKKGQTAVLAALRKGNAKIFNILQEHENTQLRQPKFLNEAIEGGNIELVKTVLDSGLNINAILEIKGKYRPDEELDYMDPRVMTALKKAVEENKPEIAGLLLERGAEGVQYFLLQALSKGNVSLVKTLADKVGNLRALSARGMDLLTASVLDAKPEMIEFLLDKNVGDVNAALLRMMTSRENDENYMTIFDTFLKSGAKPTAEMLTYSLKKDRTEQFNKLASCLAEPNPKVDGEEDNVFLYAVRHNNVSAVKFFLEHQTDVWQSGHDGISAIEYAVKQIKDNPEIYQLFRQNLSDINSSGYKGETLLMLLAQNGLAKEFMEVVNVGGDIWQKDNQGKTMLMYAAEGGNEEIMNYLVKKGDNPDAVDRFGRTPLIYAAQAGQLAAVNNLINKGVMTNAADDNGKSAIMYAASKGRNEIVSRMLDEGESASAIDKNRKNVLMYALESGDLPTINTIVSKGVDVLTQDRSNNSTMHFAVKGGNPEAVKMLKQKRVDIYGRDKDGYQPAILALKFGQKEIFDILECRLDNLNEATRDNGTTLPMFALEGENIDLIRLISAKFPNLYNKADDNGVTFVMKAVQFGRPDLVRDIIAHNGNILLQDKNGKSVLMYAAEGSNPINLINVLSNINNEQFITAKDRDKKTALIYAVSGKYNQIIKQQRLFQHGASALDKDKDSKTVLMYAVGNHEARVDSQAIRELLFRGANVNSIDSQGRTALMYAAENPMANMNIIESLLASGANVHAKDYDGKTVLMYAAEGGDISKFRLLLESGASTSGTTKDGKNVQDFADKIGSCFADAVRRLIKG